VGIPVAFLLSPLGVGEQAFGLLALTGGATPRPERTVG
jgi:hypothetical protein